jgi:outer membrane protein OmpA-like peptidoglycan-associated protein
MRTKPFVASVLGTLLISAGVMTAYAQEGFYDPSNAASPSGKTVGHELNATIGCPGRGLLDKPCVVPKEAAPAPAPVDSDGDGVIDSKDKCPGTPAGRKVNADGCELDSDGDGVVDGLDKCPGTPAGRKVNAEGCEFDTDGDGIVDGDDKCPTIYAKTADGCPPPLVLEGVHFDNNKATLRPESFAILDKTAEAMKHWADAKIEVAGHTDSNGSDKHNMDLSQRRAEAVRDYLISKGIAADRLVAKGYGESHPIADNKTAAGRLINRRVELQRMN